MEYAGFIGPTYQALSATVSNERCVNWYPELLPGGAGGKTSINYYPTPGLTQRVNGTPAGVCRGLYALNGRTFAVISGTFLEFFPKLGTFTPIGSIANDLGPVYFASNGSQIMMSSAGLGYLYTLSGDLIQIVGGTPADGSDGEFFGSSMCTFLDDYLIALTPNSRQFQISGLNDGTAWSALDIGINGGSPDNLVALIADHEYLYLWGNARSAVWYETGNADFPFAPVSGAFIEQGCAAPGSVKRADNTILWLGADEQGDRVLWRANGFIPQRISTHAVEQAWQKYDSVSDAIAFVSQRNGHTEYRITFPSGKSSDGATPATGDATWVYDLATQMWHERASFDPPTGTLHQQIQQFHCFANGAHYVGGTDGVIYSEDQGVYTDGALPIKRLRIGPNVYSENKTMFVSRLEIVLQAGVGLDGPLTAQGAVPQMILRYSGNGGRAWSNEMTAYAGGIGQDDVRSIFDRLGSGRSWCAELSATDPVNWVVVGAEIEAQKGLW